MASRRDVALTAYRIASSRHPIFDGGGAALHDARWHKSGRRVIYCALSYAGAILENLVHAGIGKLPSDHVFVQVSIPEGVAIEEVELAALSPDWTNNRQLTQEIGNSWYDEGRSAVLCVPSAVAAEGEKNVLINQTHPDFSQVQVSDPAPVRYDERLARRGADVK